MIDGHGAAITVTVPGGLLAGETLDHYRRFETAGLRPLTGLEEDWLAGNRGKASALIASRLLNACLVQLDGREPPENTAGRLLAGDRDYLILQLRRLTLGDSVHSVADCPRCGAKIDVSFDASKIPVDWRPQNAPAHSVQLSNGRTVQFRLPTGADQERIAEMELEPAAARLFECCVIDDGASSFLEEEKEELIGAMGKVAPGIDLELELSCPECSFQFVMPFDTTSFFFEEMRIQDQQLLREVHALALYYHWSERDILSLDRGRRRKYLALLRDATREG
jgi:hypothetical protein